MDKLRLNNYRMGGYLLLAVGLINLRYQTGQSSVLNHSLVLIVPGIALLAATFLAPTQKWLATRQAAAVVVAVGALLLIYSFIN